MSTIKVSIVSSSEEIYSGEGTMVFATGSLGEIGIAPGHTPLLTGLAPGPVRVQNGDDEKTFFVQVDLLKYNLIWLLSYLIELNVLNLWMKLKLSKHKN